MSGLLRHFSPALLSLLAALLAFDAATACLVSRRPHADLQAAIAQSRPEPGVTFVDVAREAGLTVSNVWGGRDSQTYIIEVKGSGLAFFDYDNDGWLDVYLSNGVRFEETYTPSTAPISRLYRNNRDGTFTDVTARAGVGRTGWGTGVCIGDYDNDGGNRNASITVKLIGTRCNRTAVGARVRVVTGSHAQIGEVCSGGSVMSQNDLRLHFGLGGAALADRIEVRWPTTHEVERFPRIEANQILTIREGSGIIKKEKYAGQPAAGTSR